MKGRLQLALAVAAGYFLGRRHKLRWATALAAAGAVGGIGRVAGGGLLGKGAKMLGASPEMEQMVGRLREELTEVGKAAAVAATNKQLDSLTTKLHDRAESLRSPGVPSARRSEEEAEEPEAEYEEEEEEEEETRRPKAARRERPTRTLTRRGR
jgi:DNA anti-recombination protein RmuC